MKSMLKNAARRGPLALAILALTVGAMLSTTQAIADASPAHAASASVVNCAGLYNQLAELQQELNHAASNQKASIIGQIIRVEREIAEYC